MELSNKTYKRIIICSVAVILVISLVTGYLLGQSMSGNSKNPGLSDSSEQKYEPLTPPEDVNGTDELVDFYISNMSLSEMVYQMMFVTPESLTKVATVVAAGDATKTAINKYPVGGVIYFSQNFETRSQTYEMINNTKSYSKIPLFIAVDEEGGVVSRLGSNPAMGTTKQPTMQSIGETGDYSKAYDVGVNLAKDLKSLGFNVDFAPVADVIVNKNNTEIGDRSFGTDPKLVAEMVKNVVLGLEDNGVCATLKHFPGHGSTSVDSHTGYSKSERTIEELRATEFLPFKSGISADVEFIMVSHMTLVNATKEKLPASLSEEVITDMLITELGFEGIVITDSLQMGAITNEYSNEQAAVMAVKAGADMLLMPPDIEAAHSAIMNAVENGELSKEKIEQSVRKILKAKVTNGIIG